jgi:hypothetical protein
MWAGAKVAAIDVITASWISTVAFDVMVVIVCRSTSKSWFN